MLWLALLILMMAQNDHLRDRAQRLHFSSLLVDTHIDTTSKVQRREWDFTREHAEGHVDLPRMRKGGLDAAFFSIFMPGTVVGHQAVANSLEQIAAIHKLTEDLAGEIVLCFTAAQVRQAHKQGKIAALMGMEGGHMINNSLPVLRMYANLGVRYLTLTHGVHTDWADSSGGNPRHGGMTDFGRDAVRELNRQGVMVDISHVSDDTFWEALEVTQAPPIASHSSCRAISNHPRNLSDEMIKALAHKGGVIQITFVDQFLDQALYEYYKHPQAQELQRKYPDPASAAWGREELAKILGPPPRVSWEKIVEHIEHAVKLVGVDHVGIGSDFDGATMPEGMEDASHLPRITDALLHRGYTERDIQKILGGNVLRVMEEVERAAAKLKNS